VYFILLERVFYFIGVCILFYWSVYLILLERVFYFIGACILFYWSVYFIGACILFYWIVYFILLERVFYFIGACILFYWSVYFILLHLIYSRWLQLYLYLLFPAGALDYAHAQDNKGFVLGKAESCILEVRACKCYIIKRIRDGSVTTVKRLGAWYPGIRL
jgi:hypothetical protein